ncbi:hydantoinase/oxoprolinase family protein [Rhodococcus aetherivorans]|nr:hydantoinase/oxoprolinase family protein [Rhodococcus aetherivorans]WFS13565.1 hydantoinase/oxoprolinase family protein [Rhodococcus aetherivorans]
MSATPSIRIGVDVGGTFTDFLVVHEDGTRLVHKTSSIPSDPSTAVVKGLTEIAERRGETLTGLLAQVHTIVHGTTVTTNALLTRTGAKTGLLTTEGFRDVLQMRDGTREDAYDNRLTPPAPLVPRALRRPVGGRLDHEGTEVTPLATDDVRAAAELFRREGVEAVAVSFMHSHAGDEHERQAADILAAELPGVYLTRSSELLPQVRYYDRTSTAVLNSYAGPIITRYLRVLTEALDAAGFTGILLLMQSNGGVATPTSWPAVPPCRCCPARRPGPPPLLEVAPHGWDRCLTVDMGGTSFDAAVVNDGTARDDRRADRPRPHRPAHGRHPHHRRRRRQHRLRRRGRPAARRPRERRRRPRTRLLRPRRHPRYRHRRRRRPRLRRPRELPRRRHPPRPGGLDRGDPPRRRRTPRHLRRGGRRRIYDVVNVGMAAGVREITVRRGLDARDFPIVVAGGAGPVHAAAIARELEIPVLVTPRESSIFCAAACSCATSSTTSCRATRPNSPPSTPENSSGSGTTWPCAAARSSPRKASPTPR